MQYLFFDCEGANCYDFVSKMCTLGYVICDENYKVKTKIDVILNPEADFDRHIIKMNMNAYPIGMYATRPDFKYFYHSFKHILEADDQLIVGWSIENDVKYVYDGCSRYKCKQIKYTFLDIQKVYMKMENMTNQPALETVCESLNIEVLTSHKSDDDAMMTLLITKALCKKLNLTLQQIFEQNPDCVSTVDEYKSRAMTPKEIEQRIVHRRVVNAMKRKYNKQIRKGKKIKNGDVFAFTTKAIDEYGSPLVDTIKVIQSFGALCTLNHSEANIIVCVEKEKFKLSSHERNKEKKIINIDQLDNLIIKEQ